MKKDNSQPGLWFCSILLAINISAASQSVSIDLNTEYQSISGFGGVNMPGWIDDLSEDLVDKSFGNDPGQIGLSILRIRVPNDTTQFYREVPTAVLAKNHGAVIMASPWSPPAALKSNNNTTGGYLLPENYGAFADHLLKFASYMSNSGAPLHAVSIQNEPDIQVNYESCDWYASQMIDFLEGQGSKFDAINVIAPESYQFKRPLSDSILNDPEAEPHVDIIGGHIYGGGLFDYPLARSKGKEVWMTEHLTGSNNPEDNTWSLALSLATEINDCMKANFSAYVWWFIRRFYALITEDGNISKKGYVMTQFSKFIRPGAVRVEAMISDVTGVDATAFTTDSTLVIVVINSNDADVDLDFTIQNNIGIDTLTQFTTSETKNMVNDGSISVSGDIFSTTVDAGSIATFTTYAENGGKFNNLTPIADAGEDIELIDSDQSGLELVTLDGTASSDPDGSIANYSWAIDSIQVAYGPIGEITLPIGEYVAILTVTDDDGATHADSVNIAVNSRYNTEIWFEAECGTVGSTWEINTDEEASNNEYVNTPGGIESAAEPSTNVADHLIYRFQVEEDGYYKVWGRLITPTFDDDSFWIKMDNGVWVRWNGIAEFVGSEWGWDDVHDEGGPILYELLPGSHTLTICFREDGALLDKLYITNTAAVPSGVGESDTTCMSGPDNIQTGRTDVSDVHVYPNPAVHEVKLKWDSGFNLLQLFTLDGRKMLEKKFADDTESAQLIFDIEPGIYLIQLSNETARIVTKLIIQ